MGIVMRILGVILTVLQTIGSGLVPINTFNWAEDLFSDSSKASYSQMYYELQQNGKNNTDIWRQGMISGNGLQGVITSVSL